MNNELQFRLGVLLKSGAICLTTPFDNHPQYNNYMIIRDKPFLYQSFKPTVLFVPLGTLIFSTANQWVLSVRILN